MSSAPSPALLYDLVGHLPRGETAPVAAELAPTTPAGCLIDVLGIVPTHAGPGACRAEMVVGPQHLNMRGIAQGGALLALADAAAAWASYAALPRGQFTTIDVSFKLLRPASLDDRLVATASPVHLGRRLLVLEVLVGRGSEDNDHGALVAKATCTQMVLDQGNDRARS
ncbi:MAG: PaaI family thioesterase [Acidimicrobiales bacterium]